MITREDGTSYCPLSGHAQFDCQGYDTEEHFYLLKHGFGVSYGGIPTDEEVRQETRNDRELMLDEFHGRDI